MSTAALTGSSEAGMTLEALLRTAHRAVRAARHFVPNPLNHYGSPVLGSLYNMEHMLLALNWYGKEYLAKSLQARFSLPKSAADTMATYIAVASAGRVGGTGVCDTYAALVMLHLSAYAEGPCVISMRFVEAPGYPNTEHAIVEVESGGNRVVIDAWPETPRVLPPEHTLYPSDKCTSVMAILVEQPGPLLLKMPLLATGRSAEKALHEKAHEIERIIRRSGISRDAQIPADELFSGPMIQSSNATPVNDAHRVRLMALPEIRRTREPPWRRDPMTKSRMPPGGAGPIFDPAWWANHPSPWNSSSWLEPRSIPSRSMPLGESSALPSTPGSSTTTPLIALATIFFGALLHYCLKKKPSGPTSANGRGRSPGPQPRRRGRR